MAAHVTEADPTSATLSPEVESVLSGLLDAAVARGELTQATAHAVFLAAWHMAAMPDDDAEKTGVGRVWPSELRRSSAR